jgi:hypothetical protein
MSTDRKAEILAKISEAMIAKAFYSKDLKHGQLQVGRDRSSPLNFSAPVDKAISCLCPPRLS